VKRLLIVGCRGMLGSDLMTWKWKNWEVRGVDVDELDITQRDAVHRFIRDLHPKTIINAAAYTRVDDCEKEEALARRINALGPKYLAEGAKEIGAHLIHISTDYVFDGTRKEPYSEWDLPNPINAYGRTKLWGEQMVQQVGGEWTLVRTQWLYGTQGPNFVEKMISLARERPTLNVVNDQTGCPTCTVDLVRQLVLLAEERLLGLVHASSMGCCTWYEFAKSIFLGLKWEHVDLKPIDSSDLALPAKRPIHSVLENGHLSATGLDIMPSWQDGLLAHLKRETTFGSDTKEP